MQVVLSNGHKTVVVVVVVEVAVAVAVAYEIKARFWDGRSVTGKCLIFIHHQKEGALVRLHQHQYPSFYM